MVCKQIMLFVVLFATSMSGIECCKTKWNAPQTRAPELTTHEIKVMTTTEDFPETTTDLNPETTTDLDPETTTDFNTEQPTTEIDFTTTDNQDIDNVETTTTDNKNKKTIRLPGHTIDASETYKNNRCIGLHEEAFCMNGGKCINYTMPNAPAMMILSCECAEGFMGERCDSKYWEGTYKLHDVPSDQSEVNTIDHHIYERRQPKQHHETNSASSVYRTAQIRPATAITTGIVLAVSYCSYRIFLR